MTINTKETSTGEINLKTTKDLINELTIRLGTCFVNSSVWPNGINEILIDLWQHIAKLEGLYIDGLQEGFIKGQNSVVFGNEKIH